MDFKKMIYTNLAMASNPINFDISNKIYTINEMSYLILIISFD